jgi:aspartate racemase
MKTIGIIGGMSWESSLEYYRTINQMVKERLGGLHSAQCLMYSVDFAPIAKHMHDGEWDRVAQPVIAAAQHLERGGAEFIILATNTLHIVIDRIQREVTIPFIHIADATAEQVTARGKKTVGLLGTRFTMEEEFYRGRLSTHFGIAALIPHEKDRQLIHRVIFDELVLGTININSKKEFVRIIEDLVRSGAEGIILGCTEIGLLVQDSDSRVPLFDTARIHARAAVELALAT